ncbi:MAG: carbohydrate kinase [Phormidesmis sp.]
MNRAICLGEIWVDCFAEQSGLPRSKVTSWAPLPGGASANVACALAKLGGQVEFIGAVGRDAWGDALVKLLSDMGVGHQGVQRRLKAPTRRVYILHEEAEDAEQKVRHSAFAGFSENVPTAFADAHLFADALAPELFAGASFLVLGTLAMAYADTRQSVHQAVNLAREQGAAILVDVNWRPMFWPSPAEAPGQVYDLLQKVQFLKVSVEESEWLFGTACAAAIAHQLPHLSGVLVTTRVNGCHYWLAGNIGAVPGFVVDVEDAAGADDAFTAGFVYQLLLRGLTCLKAADVAQSVVNYASAVSALTMTRPGSIAALPTPTEVAAFLYLNPAC